MNHKILFWYNVVELIITFDIILQSMIEIIDVKNIENIINMKITLIMRIYIKNYNKTYVVNEYM